MNQIDTVQSFTSNQFIYRMKCDHWKPDYSIGASWFHMYSATGQSPWQISPTRAWEDLDTFVAGIVTAVSLFGATNGSY